MNRASLPFRRLIAHLLWLLLFYFCFRVAFYSFNAAAFPDMTAGQLLAELFKGMRFDLSAIMMTNVLFIFLLLLPWHWSRHCWYERILAVVFYLSNGLAFLFEIADWMYFPFNHKRSTAEVLDIVTSKGDFLNLLPGFLKDYWYIFMVAAVFLWLMIYTYRLTVRRFQRREALQNVFSGKKKWGWRQMLTAFVLLLAGAVITVYGIRGGTQYVPIGIRSAVTMTRSELTPLILNTPFSIIKSVADHHLDMVHYLPEDEAVAALQPIKYYGEGKAAFKPDNVVFIILESFSKEFTGLTNNTRSYTPFLDSLMRHSMTFTNAYANALHSAEGIPALIGGIPTLMDEYYTLSRYNNNRIDAVPYLLKQMGYSTAFYHGGTNGTMGFDNFASAAGFDHYYGRSEYHNEKDYDGDWGIFDEPFLQYFARGLDKMPQPFMASVFTVTSHPPYPMPQKYKGKFPGGKLDIYPCVGYTDNAVREFFNSVKDKSWFKHTLFIISPDHCSPVASDDYYTTGTGRYQIPIIFYAPGDSTMVGYNRTLIQQIDVLPSIMDYLHYPDSFFCFGNSVFRKSAPRFVINRLNKVYNWMNDGYQSMILDDSVLAAYAFPADSLRKHNLVGADNHFRLPPASDTLFRAFVQLYNQALIKNKMSVKNFDKGLPGNHLAQ